eukprot:Hpha_TRINITY_DN14999_c2_g10::TRINITY_DN14999_c2_g10_i1::g.143696::m.143696
MAAAGGWAQGACVRKLQQELREAGKTDFIVTEGIYIAPHEDDMTQVDALIIGPEDTPYEGGFFHFAMKFPPEYPLRPPSVRLLTTDGGCVRFGPNLYADGKVCLSILGTWPEGPQWTAEQSLRSVLLSVQSLMNEKPYHNEPGFEGPERQSGDAARYGDMVRHETLRVAVAGMLEHPTWSARTEVAEQLTKFMQETARSGYKLYAKSLDKIRERDGEEFNDPFHHMRSGRHDHCNLTNRLWAQGLLHKLEEPMPAVEVSTAGGSSALVFTTDLPAPPGCGDAIRGNATEDLVARCLGAKVASLQTVEGKTELQGGRYWWPRGAARATAEVGGGRSEPDAAAVAETEKDRESARAMWSSWQSQCGFGDAGSPSSSGGDSTPAGAGTQAARQLSGSQIAQEEDEERKCRYCLCGEDEDDADDPLVTPCRCKGDQRWCHRECLKRWQRSVLVQQPTHPQHYRDDKRQTHCNVCRSEFNVPPPSRAELMRSFSGEELAQLLEVGCLIVTEPRTSHSMEQLVRNNPHVPQVQGMVHWVRGVYLITNVDKASASDESDLICAVNLGGRAARQIGKNSNLDYHAASGGPCYPSLMHAASVLGNTPHEELPAVGTAKAVREQVWRGGMQGGLWVVGDVESVSDKATKDRARAVQAGDADAPKPLVRVWFGDARWSRTQLLGELARGGWGMCRAEAGDLAPNPNLWDEVIKSKRLIFAPKNEMMSDDQESSEEEDDEEAGGDEAAPAATESRALRDARERLAKDRLRRQLLDQQRELKDDRLKRLKDEASHWQRDPPVFVSLESPGAEAWELLVDGPPGTPFAGGCYAAVLVFPPGYPAHPPVLRVTTPNGRIPAGEPVPLPCLEQWNKRTSVATIAVHLVTALLAPGGESEAEKERLAAASVAASPELSRRRSSLASDSAPVAPAGAAAAEAFASDLCVGERVKIRHSSRRPEAGRCGIVDSSPGGSAGTYTVNLAGGGKAAKLRRADIEPTALQIGHPVRIVGVQEKKELNGIVARVTDALLDSDYLTEAERYKVRTADGRDIVLPRANLEENLTH